MQENIKIKINTEKGYTNPSKKGKSAHLTNK